MDLGTNIYRFHIRRGRLCGSECRAVYTPGVCTCAGVACDDFTALRMFLADNPGIKVIVERNSFWYSIEPTGASETCLSKPSPEQVWGCAIGELARQYPNLVGWSLDDFFSKKMYGSFLGPSRAKAACAPLHDPVTGAPHVKVYATIYCNYDAYDSCACALGMDVWWQHDSLPTWETAFVAYVNSDPQLRACITGVTLYTRPDELTVVHALAGVIIPDALPADACL